MDWIGIGNLGAKMINKTSALMGMLVSRDMRRNPINLILTGIAVADLLMMLEYIPFAAHMYLLKYQGSR